MDSFCVNDTSRGDPNMLPIADGPPRLIRTVPNGLLYQVGVDEDQSWLVHVWGMNGYEYGFAYGTLLSEQIIQFFPKAYAYLEKDIIDHLESLKLPKWVKQLIADEGLAFALDMQNSLAQVYVDPEIYRELHGIADATKIDYDLLLRLHMFGELTRGYIGVLTGMSSTMMGIGSIGIRRPDDTFGDESMMGIPFIFLQRYLMQYSETLDDALSYITNIRRTCHLILGISDGKLGTGRIIQYSHSLVHFFDDINLQPLTDWHPRIDNVVYEGMDWTCPAFQSKLYEQIRAEYGQITPETTIQNIPAVVKTGDVQVAVYDLTDNVLYVANARGEGEQGPRPAYQRQFIKLDLNVEYARVLPTI
ncbi:unnamed protein product [Rotaria sp. Silwood1]|nr:unnamed protein product [Rotaria sp. Silwood1]CAF1639350.1 unnamed protein product [Rotaria sp. Silwood1]CAF3866676.1 unnamed protein product [Rotaria sp. Silwood1]CAF3884975.1 unnamed protein product [Rotaria sp. Silwood1]